MSDQAPARIAGSAFDGQHPPSNEIIEKCVHCGFCLPVCPTYVLWGQEMDSPRGRIYLMKLASEGATEMTSNWVSHFDSCLGCMACMPACPSGVDYGKLIEATRAQIERNTERSPAQKRYRRFLFENFTQPERLKRLRLPLLAYQKSGLQAIVRALGLLKLLPKRLQVLEALLPRLGRSEQVAELTPAAGTKRLRVGLLLGCVQREFFPQVNAATARVLAAEGCEIIAPSAQPCCGALLVHAGEEAAALELAKKTIDAFEGTNVDAIVSNAAGCGSNVKDYAYLLRDDPAYANRARSFSAKCKDISEVLAGLEQPSEGLVIMDGREVVGPSLERGVVFQGHALMPWLTVRENIAFAVRSRWTTRRRAEVFDHTQKYVELVGLAGAEHKKPAALSGGMKQRVGIARAFAIEPKMLLLDEPFGALDALTRGTIQDELLRIVQATHQTVFMITHDVDEAILLADKILLMSNGPRARIVEIVVNTLPRERTRHSLHHDPQYYRIRNHLVDFLVERSTRMQAADDIRSAHAVVSPGLVRDDENGETTSEAIARAIV